MAKTLVAKVAKSANVAYTDPATVLARLDEYVSSAAGELGLLSLRPRENPRAQRRRTKASAQRLDRAIGGGLRGKLLQAVYVRIAAWIVKTGESPIVVATDEEIADLLPLLVGSAHAERFTTTKGRRQPGASIARTLSSLAFDWKAVIGNGATVRVEDSSVDVTFHLSGGSGERQFSLHVAIETAAGTIPLIGRPTEGRKPAISLSQVVHATAVFDQPYMRWAEMIRVAALNGDKVALGAVKLLKGVVYASKVIGVLLLCIALSGLVLFLLPAHGLQAEVIDRIQQFLRTYVLRNERSDYGLPPRLKMPGAAFFEDAHFAVQSAGGNTIVVTVKDAEGIARHYESMWKPNPNLPPDATGHIEWEWRIRPRHIATPIYKRTENPQLRVVLDRPNAWIEELGCQPIRVYHAMSDPIHVPGPGMPPAPPPGPPSRETLDALDLLIIGNPATYDRPSPGVEEHGWYRLDGPQGVRGRRVQSPP